MSQPITDAMQQAQDAISGGNYRAAVATCSRIVKQFPAYAAAQRLLGEAYLEQGQSAEAERAFAAALSGNPRQPFAYLGLGLLAEDRGATDTALAYCQVAWELAPQLAQLREPVVRVSARRYGAEGQLQLTRAALAQLHANSSRLRRAAAEYRSALADLPERVDLLLGLAETLWRLGELDEANALAGRAARQQPDAVQALVIQADIEHRAGDARRAEELRGRLRAVDPDGEATAALLAAHPAADRDFLRVPDDAIPTLSEQVDAVVAERPHIAPAPDFAYVPSRPEAPLPDLEDLQPISAEEFGALGQGESPVAALPEQDGLPDFGALGFEDFSEAPFDPDETMPSFIGGSAAAPVADVVMDDDLSALAAALDGEVAQAARPAAPSIADEIEPFDFAAFEQSAGQQLAPDAGPTGDLDAELAALDREVPPAETPRGYTTVLQELDSAGLAPFDALHRAAPHDAPAPAPDAPGVGGGAQSQPDDLASMAASWDDIDAEIQNAVPWQEQRGFTDQLRSLEEIGLEPFEFDDEGVDEFVQPAQSSAPSHVEEPVAAPDAEPRAALDAADDALLSGLEPFVFEDIARSGVGGALPASAHDLDAAASKSAVPSDADLSALLAIEEEPFLDLEPQPRPRPEPEPEPEPEMVSTEAPAGDESGPVDQSDVTAGIAEARPQHESQPDEFEQFIHSTLAATRALPSEAAPEVADADPAPADEVVEQRDTRGMTELLFERARVAKDQLVAEGVIAGDREFATDAPAEPADALVEPQARSLDMNRDGDADIDAEPEAEAPLATGASRDTQTLRAALLADPNDAELHWWLAEALRERGDIADAYGEYRWVIRNAPERHDAVLRALTECVERGQQPEMGHRLLADVYRRRGDVSRASSHAARALQRSRSR